jgi:hypothetical protein
MPTLRDLADTLLRAREKARHQDPAHPDIVERMVLEKFATPNGESVEGLEPFETIVIENGVVIERRTKEGAS